MDFSISSIDLNIYDWIMGGALLFFFLIQLFFYLLLYRKPYRYEKKREVVAIADENLPSVSVIIASKNESDNLEVNLPAILSQDYPNFEVIVVNCGSTDETDMVLKGLEQNHNNLYQTYIPENAETKNEKKLALTVGIKAAKNDILLFTEANCKPCSDQWIREFASAFQGGKEIVLGFCKLDFEKKFAFRRFTAFDNLILGIKYLSMAIIHKPFMGIGRNMAYRKELFFREKGFSSILNIEDGEDDLFINRSANGMNTTVAISPESMTTTNIVDRFSTWKALKSKYLYTKQYYKGAQSFIFGCETFSKYGFYLSVAGAILLFAFNYTAYLIPAFAALLFLIRYIFQLIIINKNSHLFGVGKFHVNLFFFDLILPLVNFRFRRYAKLQYRKRRRQRYSV